MTIKLTWFNHATFRIAAGNTVVYIDPWKLSESPGDGDVVLISHSHYDHLSADDIARVLKPTGQVFGPADVAARVGGCIKISPGEQKQAGQVRIAGVRAYNTDKEFHPRANDWLGWLVELSGKRIYYAGDTDLTAEMGELGKVDLALLPVGGTYTMDAEAAAEAAQRIAPGKVVPYHWGDIVGGRDDAERFAGLVGERAVILSPGETLELD